LILLGLQAKKVFEQISEATTITRDGVSDFLTMSSSDFKELENNG